MTARIALLGALLVALLTAPSAVAQTASDPPRLSAKAAIVMETTTGDVLMAKNADVRRQIASTTKLMTVLVALERDDLDDIFSAADYDPAPAESQIGLRPGERMSVRDLLRATLLPSANDAAATLAVGTMGSTPAFVAEMNRRAQALGLTDTRYANPVGLDDPDNYSTAQDLARLAIRLRRYEFFRRTVDLRFATLRSGALRRTVLNRNDLVRNIKPVNGVKTGYTRRAGNVLVGSASRDGVTVVSVVLGEPSERARDADSLALLRYGLDSYNARTVLPEGRVLGRIDLRYRGGRVGRGHRGRDRPARPALRDAHDDHRERPAGRGRRPAAARKPRRHGHRAQRRRGDRPRAGRHRAAGRRGRPRHAPGRHAGPLADDRRPGGAAGL